MKYKDKPTEYMTGNYFWSVITLLFVAGFDTFLALVVPVPSQGLLIPFAIILSFHALILSIVGIHHWYLAKHNFSKYQNCVANTPRVGSFQVFAMCWINIPVIILDFYYKKDEFFAVFLTIIILILLLCIFYLVYIYEVPKPNNDDNSNSYIPPMPISVECPYCHSTNTVKITVVDKGIVKVFSKGHSPIRYKQWHCNTCKSDF